MPEIVGGRDTRVLALNRAAQARLRCPNELVTVPGATHLFEDPGTLAAAAHHAQAWFSTHLRHAAPMGRPALDRMMILLAQAWTGTPRVALADW